MERKPETDYLLTVACDKLRKALQCNNGKRTVLPIAKKGNTIYTIKRSVK